MAGIADSVSVGLDGGPSASNATTSNYNGHPQDTSTRLPIFQVENVDIQFSVAADFAAAQVANNVLVLALANNRIMRVDLSVPEDIDEIELPRKANDIGVIRRMFLDPTASHLIVGTSLDENFYLHMQSRQAKALAKLRGHTIECVSWNPSQPTASTREILLGGRDGKVYETYIDNSTEFYRSQDRYLKLVYRVEGGRPVTAIWTDTIPGKSELRRVLVATPARLLHFLGKFARQSNDGSGSIFAKLFESERPTVLEAGGTGTETSAFVVTPEGPDTPAGDTSKPERIFAWMAAQHVLLGKLSYAPAAPDLGARIFNEARRVTGQSDSNTQKSAPALPSHIALTQWHMLKLIGNRLVATNRLDDSVVYDQAILTSGQRPLALVADMKKNTFWLFTNKAIYEVIATDEDRDVWKVMLRAQKFEEALQYANNSAQRDAVATASGDYLISKGKFMDAASVYGKSSKPFEKVALTFIDHGQRDALRKYLVTKLSLLKKSAIMQRIMLTSWLVELYMAKLNALDDSIMTNTSHTDAANSSSTNRPTSSRTTPEDIHSQLAAVRRDFQDFAQTYRNDLDRKTVYSIISSHGRESELLYFATTVNDYNYVLSYWVQRESWTEALKAVMKQTDPEIVYKYASVLMANSSTGFTDVLMRQEGLDARKLIPALLNYNDLHGSVPLRENQAARYLLFVINNNGSIDSAVHNTLLSIYAAHPTPDESALLGYLEGVTPTRSTASRAGTGEASKVEMLQSLPYDADFALRLCITHKRIRACVLIYTVMGEYASAVELALQHGEKDLAIGVAERPEHDAVARKKLWLSIAKSVITSETTKTAPSEPAGPTTKAQAQQAAQAQQPASIQTALDLLQRAPPDTLRIEDLLPLFPDFVRIDAFKDVICSALESYSSHIDTLKAEMDASSYAAERIRADAKKLDQRWVLLEPGEACAVCALPLLQRRFWVWACGHGVHADCAASEVLARGAKGDKRRVREVRALIEQGVEGKRREAAIKELDDIVGKECSVCGEARIRSVDEPFVTEADDRREWAL